MGLRLMKNVLQVATLYHYGDHAETSTNSMILHLRAFDQMRVRLQGMTWIYDNGNSLSTFTGHLLFPL